MTFFEKNKTFSAIRDFWGESINPHRDWCLLIIIFSLLMVFMISFNYKIYQITNSKELFVDISKEQITIKKIREKDMKNVLSVFEERKNNFESIRALKLVDPSL